jgi:polyhydroxyalkanoate synthase
MVTRTLDHTQWFSDLLAAQQDMLRAGSDTSSTPANLLPWLAATEPFVEWQQQVMQQFSAWWTSAVPGWTPSSGASAAADCRFASDSWTKDPRYESLARLYIAQADGLRDALEAAPLDQRTKAQWGFVLRQVIDALGPANAVTANPEVLNIAVARRAVWCSRTSLCS